MDTRSWRRISARAGCRPWRWLCAALTIPVAVAPAQAQPLVVPVDAGGRVPTNPNATLGPATFTFTVLAFPVAAGVGVNIDMVHTWTEDVNMTLTSPPGTGPISVLLFNHRGSVPAFANFDDTFFDDTAPVAIAAGPPAAVPPFRGIFRPEAPLAAFNGINPNGVWTLTINDIYFGDYGWLYRAGNPTFETRRPPMAGTHLVILPVPATCYPNCDRSTMVPCLNVLDFACFLNKFAAGDPYANCDNSTMPPTLNVLDFACFLNAFAAGCSSC